MTLLQSLLPPEKPDWTLLLSFLCFVFRDNLCQSFKYISITSPYSLFFFSSSPTWNCFSVRCSVSPFLYPRALRLSNLKLTWCILTLTHHPVSPLSCLPSVFPFALVTSSVFSVLLPTLHTLSHVHLQKLFGAGQSGGRAGGSLGTNDSTVT